MVWSYKKISGCGQFFRISSDLYLNSTLAHIPLGASILGSRLSGQHASTVSARPISAASRTFCTTSGTHLKQRALGIDTVVSVLEASATKRDAKTYLNKYAPKGDKSSKIAVSPSMIKQRDQEGTGQEIEDGDAQVPRPKPVAIVKLRYSQDLDTDTIQGIAKTLCQLRMLGLTSVLVLDCGLDETREVFKRQSMRVCEAIDSFSKLGSRFYEDLIVGRPQAFTPPSILVDGFQVDDYGALKRAIENGTISVVPSLARPDSTRVVQPVDANLVVLALTKYLSGKESTVGDGAQNNGNMEPLEDRRIASVERIIILDPLGGTPVSSRPGAVHRFINLEQEFELLMRQIKGTPGSPLAYDEQVKGSSAIHASNITLAQEALSILPSSSSALITTPLAAANLQESAQSDAKKNGTGSSRLHFEGMVTTRRRQNPLLHNLLTDKPIFSSSLPVQRIQDTGINQPGMGASTGATLVKRGMPLTIYPDPRIQPWIPHAPDGPRLRLTDNCIDLPRLQYLIEDSFNRRLDLEDYLKRVNSNLAGVIIAGEYEGGAILTWEKPDGLDYETAYKQGRLVPYLDKFAVLKSRQGSGGVADILFNAMVVDCFRTGVCWRSRKDNPVNKWYFDRSAGTSKLSNSNWTMFWTTPGLSTQDASLQDYESVCRAVEPSWLDNKHIVD